MRAEIVGAFLPGPADVARQQVRDQQVVQVAFEIAKRQDDVLPGFERLDDLGDAVRRRFLDDVVFAKQAAQFVVQAFGGHHVDAVLVRPGRDAFGVRHSSLPSFILDLDLVAVHRLEAAEPVAL